MCSGGRPNGTTFPVPSQGLFRAWDLWRELLSGSDRTDAAASVGMVGVPMAAIFDYAMGTPSGHAAFLDPEVNRMLKKILNEWGSYLKVCATCWSSGFQRPYGRTERES